MRGFPVDHSVYGATAWAVETSAGWVVYSGDVRLHGGYGDYTRRFAEEAAKLDPIALMIEGTRIDPRASNTEGDGERRRCLDVVRQCKGLVIADFGPRNVERLISFLRRSRGRRAGSWRFCRRTPICSTPCARREARRRSRRSMARAFASTASIRAPRANGGGQILDAYPHLCLTPEQVAANQDKFICCLSFWDVNELPYIRPVPGSVWISSNCEAFNEEMGITAERLDNWLKRFGMRREGRLSDKEQEPDPFHVSGHASGPDLMEIVRTIRPKTLIPIHTEKPGIYAEQVGDVCEVRVPERGRPIEY